MLISTSKNYVITGGPGAGKSTLIAALRKAGFSCALEAGRSIIQDQVAIGGKGLPWCDPVLFAELMLSFDMRCYHDLQNQDGPIFFDRGIPDVAGYLQMLGLPLPAHIQNAIGLFRYNQRVFVAPPWEKIFRQDEERKQSFGEAIRIYEAMVTIYSESGYRVIEIPKTPVEERLAFILQNIL